MFYKKVDYKSNKACFHFLAGHYRYKGTIAHNVKLYNLPVDYDKASRALEQDMCFTLNDMLYDWEAQHKGFVVYFDGRQGGYLCLKEKNQDERYSSLFQTDWDSPITYYNQDYEGWKEDVTADFGSLKEFHNTLVEEVKLVQDFDKLADDLLEALKQLIKDMEEEDEYRETHTHQFKATKRHEHYVYDTLDDMKYHEIYMLQNGARIFDKSEEDLYIEFEVDKFIEGEVIVE